MQFTSITDRTGKLNNFFGRQALRGCLFAMLKACYNDTIFGLKPVVHSSFPFVRTSIEHLAKWHCGGRDTYDDYLDSLMGTVDWDRLKW